VFFYTYAGIGSTATFNVGVLAGESYLGSLLAISFAYALGIVLAVTVCAMSSGGHFNPPVTIAFAMFRGFPWRKVPYFIAAQLLGAYCASMVVYGSWRQTILGIEEVLMLKGKEAVMFTPQGPAGIFALYAPAGTPLKWVFFNEFFADFFIGLVIWGCLDPSNVFVTPASVPAIISFAYFVAISGFSPNGLSANPARDIGARFMAMSIWGTKASGGTYAAIAALTAFPATILAAATYELLLADSSRVVTSGSREMITNTDRHREHRAYKYNLHANQLRGNGDGRFNDVPGNTDGSGSVGEMDKPTTTHLA